MGSLKGRPRPIPSTEQYQEVRGNLRREGEPEMAGGGPHWVSQRREQEQKQQAAVGVLAEERTRQW